MVAGEREVTGYIICEVTDLIIVAQHELTATGGKSSCTKWRKEKLMGRDRIHFTKDGYREQGTLLYRALMQSYNQMLKIRKDDE